MTVGSLRAQLEDLPDDRVILCQVVGGDGTAWNMLAEFSASIPQGSIALITVSHHELATLPSKVTHSGTGPQVFEIGVPQPGENITITFPEAAGYIISALDYEDFKAMLAWWRSARAITGEPQ